MEASHDGDGCLLKELPGVLIGHFWPKERVLMAMKVSKWLRGEILANTEAVLFSAANARRCADPYVYVESEEMARDRLVRDLTKFSHGGTKTKVYLRMDNVTTFVVSRILNAIVDTFNPKTPLVLPISAPPPKLKSTRGHSLAGLAGLYMDRLGSGDGEILPFLEALQHCSAMEEVAIREFWIGDDGRACLAKAIASFRDLKCLDLRLYLGDEGAEQLAQALVSCKALQKLTLHHNHIQYRGTELLADALGQCQQLTHIDIQHNILSGAAIGSALATCSNLRVLDLSHNRLDDEQARALLHNLQLGTPTALQRLHHLRLRSNDFSSCTIAELAAITWPALQTLDLDENRVCDEGASALAAALHRFSALRTLNLAHGGLRERGSVALSEALGRGECRALTELNLGWNMLEQGGAGLFPFLQICSVTDSGAIKSGNTAVDVEALAQALPGCPLLSTLKLSSNKITGGGVTAITAVLPQCQALSRLDLRSNSVPEDAAAALAGVMTQRECALYVDLRWNHFAHTRWMKDLPDLGHAPCHGEEKRGPGDWQGTVPSRSVLRLH